MGIEFFSGVGFGFVGSDWVEELVLIEVWVEFECVGDYESVVD